MLRNSNQPLLKALAEKVDRLLSASCRCPIGQAGRLTIARRVTPHTEHQACERKMGPKLITYQIGIPETFRSTAVNLYDEAFRAKLTLAIASAEERKKLFVKGFNLGYAIGAFYGDDLIGIAGFNAIGGSLTSDLTYRDLISELGFLKGNRAALIFSLYERKPKLRELVMDGIAVRSDARGMGVGKRLLEETRQYAEIHDFNRVRLDVIDTNPRARKLYERFGFKAVKTERFPQLKRFLGFGGVTTMELRV